jgi:outer membrane protein
MRILTTLLFSVALAFGAMAQKYALVDMEYILGNIPAYERASEQLNQISKKWQAEVEAVDNAAKTLYKNYQNELVFLSEQQKKEREETIIAKEREASELRKKYFGPEGELYKKRISLIEPIQEEIYNAVKTIAQQKGFQMVLDRASTSGIIFASPSIDIIADVLDKLGYSR